MADQDSKIGENSSNEDGDRVNSSIQADQTSDLEENREETTPELPPTTVELHLDYDRLVNFAMQQNDVPVVKRLNLVNSSEALDDVTIAIQLGSGLSEELHIRLDRIAPEEEINLEHISLPLNVDRLKEQSERQETELEVTVSARGKSPSVKGFPVEVLAFNEWPGLSTLPEVLAAFVLPNSRGVNALIGKTVRTHEERQSIPILDGYQSGDPNGVIEQIRSIYETLAREDLGYVGVPASFEDDGQKVRFPDVILQDKVGNCLDLSLLAASVMEQCGLNPIIVLTKGHAFCGAWVSDHCFPEPTIDDVTSLRKRIDVEDIVVFESTLLANRPLVPFHVARSDGRKHLDNGDDFCAVIDIRRARKLKIRPLPQASQEFESEGEYFGVTTTRISPEDLATLGAEVEDATTIVPLQAIEAPTVEQQAPEEDSRIRRWQRKLLDLSLRNRLLNFRPTKKNIPLLIPDLGGFEDAVEGGVSFTLRGRPGEQIANSPRDMTIQKDRLHEDSKVSILAEDLNNRIVHVDTDEKNLDGKLLDLYRASRNELEETGSNTLFLALGFLSWKENESSNLERLAPIILLPMHLTRKSIREGFRLQRGDEDARINTTLLEKLKQDFGLDTDHLKTLPEDENGVDIDLALKNFRKVIMDVPRWDVVNNCALGLFSFNKFLMWADLESHQDSLLNSKVVRHLVETPGSAFEGNVVYPQASELDKILPAGENLCPMDADSSQLSAVIAAAQGHTFVLQGPPGTGKSQTITNLIAHCLSRGKRVLFVAEKMAALNVVHDRLSKIGLASSCLELHSKKTSKRHVLDQLQTAMTATAHKSTGEWEELAEELTDRRKDLNDYVQEIHSRRPPGLSIFQATSRLANMGDLPRVQLNLAHVHEIHRSEVDELGELAGSLGTAAKMVAPVNDHLLHSIQVSDWSPKLADHIDQAVRAAQKSKKDLSRSRIAIGEELGLPENVETDSRGQLDGLRRLFALLLENPGSSRDLLTEPGWEGIKESLKPSLDRGRQLADLRMELERRYLDELLATDVTSWLTSLQKARSSFPPLSWIRVFLTKRALKPFVRGSLADTDTLVLDLGRIQKLREEERQLAEICDQEKRFFGHHWRGARSDWQKLQEIIAWAESFRQELAQLSHNADWVAGGFRERAIRLAVEDSDQLIGPSSLRQDMDTFLNDLLQLDHRLEALDNIVHFDKLAAFGSENDEGYFDRLGKTLDNLLDGRRDLRDWCHWSHLMARAQEKGLEELGKSLGDGSLAGENALKVFKKSLLEDWLNQQLEDSLLLRRFNSLEHERKIAAFAALDQKMISLSSEVIKSRINANLPGFSKEASAKSEVGILQRQLKLKRRHMPIRRLFESLPDLLPRLKPCLLMSPLSVAQYLSTDYPRADIVVFDEASQIPVWDAIGALARGESAVIVGDSKQLPPTSFFRTQDDEDDDPDSDMVEEVESILDECEAGGFTSLNLSWHYRSRHEDLISFSNHHYYNNRLMTFPSPGDTNNHMGVHFVQVEDAHYDRAKTRTNKNEAKAVVSDVLRRLTDPQLSQDTIGIVAFSQAQQNCIEDYLDEARREHPEIESFFGEDVAEAVFVKNLENVQGDERDIILFSICYGPDADGRVSMNFGPLNREGGERRLNVAITRARKELRVFSTLRHEQIDLSRSRALGVAHLKSFLEYADRGHVALPSNLGQRGLREAESPLNEAIAKRLRERGYKVSLHVGSSSQPIDLAIHDPDNADTFILGIECDGSNYSDSANARDRDRIRPNVLKGLGWELCRVWSGDWLQDPERVLEAIEAKLVEKSDSPPPLTEEQELANELEAEENSASITDDEEGEHLKLKLVEAVEIYRPTVIPKSNLGAEALYDENQEDAVRQVITSILVQESPVSLNLVCRRLMTTLGIDRLTSRVRNRVTTLIAELPEGEKPKIFDGVYFLGDDEPSNYRKFRTAALGEIPRQADDIHPIEIANACKRVMEEQIALPLTDLPKETARMLGFPRLGSKVKAAMDKGIEEILTKGWGILDDGQVRLPRQTPKQDEV